MSINCMSGTSLPGAIIGNERIKLQVAVALDGEQ
jgi:hypothetical protein